MNIDQNIDIRISIVQEFIHVYAKIVSQLLKFIYWRKIKAFFFCCYIVSKN